MILDVISRLTVIVQSVSMGIGIRAGKEFLSCNFVEELKKGTDTDSV